VTKQLATMLLVITFLVGVGSPAVRAQDASVATLKGIRALFVLVEDLPDGAKTLGLTKEAIQTDIEPKLRLAGIRVVTQEDGRKLPGAPFLYVDAHVMPSGEAANIDVELHQDVLLKRKDDLAVVVSTWSVGYLMSNPTAQAIRDAIKDQVDTFLNAWLSVNPKK
jgi:hypothetical protein